MTMKSIPIVAGFAVITATQFALGMWMTVLAALRGGMVSLFDQTTGLILGANLYYL